MDAPYHGSEEAGVGVGVTTAKVEANDLTVKLEKFPYLVIKVMVLDLVKFLNGVDLVVDLRSGDQLGFLRREVVNWRIWWWI